MHDNRQTVESAFCERFGCSPAEFEQRALVKCLPWRARLLAPLLRALNPDHFADDFVFIHYLGQATRRSEIRNEVAAFLDANRARKSFARNTLRLRVSVRKAALLADNLMHREASSSVPVPSPSRT